MGQKWETLTNLGQELGEDSIQKNIILIGNRKSRKYRHNMKRSTIFNLKQEKHKKKRGLERRNMKLCGGIGFRKNSRIWEMPKITYGYYIFSNVTE